MSSESQSTVIDPPLDEAAAVARMRVETLYRFSFAGMGLSLLLGPLVAWRLGEVTDSNRMWYWCLGLYAVTALRGVLSWRFYRHRQRQSDRRWQQAIVASSALVGMCWGSLVLPMFVLPFEARLIVTCLMMAIVGIGLISFMASWLAFSAFAVPILLCLGFVVVTTDSGLGFDAGLLVGFFTAIMMYGSRQIAGQFDSMSRARWQEAQMRAQADQANEAKSRFLAAMSHEVRTPINGITGMAEMLRDAKLQAPFDRYLGAMQKACAHLVSVVNDVLDFARINARKLHIEPIVFDLPQMLEETLAPQDLVAKNKGLALNLHIDSSLPQWIRADRLRIAQVLINLVSNAVKFTASGSVSVKVEQVDHERMRMTVTDTGIGIEAAKLELIFEPFAQAEASSSRRYGGSGLGLSICHELVALMGGEIGIRSTVGQGSEFVVTLPLEPATAPVSASASDQQGLPDAEILIAEDDEHSREIILYFLDSLGMRARAVGDGVEAVAAFQEQAPDLILMDCEMPQMDGQTATRTLRQMGATVPILALTAHALPEHREQCLAAGMDEVLTKPIDMQGLNQALSRFLVRE